MAPHRELERIARIGFHHPRTFDALPDLPPGYDWETQKTKYCPISFLDNIVETNIQPDKNCTNPEKFYRISLDRNNCAIKDVQRNFNRLSGVFCHRGLYDRALRIPENSIIAIDNGISQGLYLHELDARWGSRPGELFLAHDEVASRVTSKARRWSSLNFSEMIETALVTRRFDPARNDFASSFRETEDKVAGFERLLPYRDQGNGDNYCTFQIDLRGDDFPRALAWFRHNHYRSLQIMLKGSNINFATGQALSDAVTKFESAGHDDTKSEWDENTNTSNMYIIMIFFLQPLISLALKAKGIDPLTASQEERSSLDYEYLYYITRTHILSFIDIVIPGYFRIIPDIVHSGLGLGYNVQTKEAVNPMDGSPISDPEVLLESRVDRAMIEVGIELQKVYPQMVFSSCTRLCDVRTSKGELLADHKTGRLGFKPEGEKGISRTLRTVHGGWFPQSDTVVADDPIAEIAARTWIDEYAKLDRTQLLKMPYRVWLAQAGEEVVKAVNKLNSPFLPNTLDGPLDDD